MYCYLKNIAKYKHFRRRITSQFFTLANQFLHKHTHPMCAKMCAGICSNPVTPAMYFYLFIGDTNSKSVFWVSMSGTRGGIYIYESEN